MSSKQKLRFISFDDQEAIRAAIRNHETFEIGGCHGRMDEAVLFVERAIGSEGMTSRVYTKGRTTAALIAGVAALPLGAAVAAGLTAHNLATLNPDYEVIKRPVDKALHLTYVKDDPTLSERISDASSAIGRGIADKAKVTSSATSSAAKSVGAAMKNVSKKVVSSASEAVNVAAETLDEHTPSKEAVVGSVLLGPAGYALVGSDGVKDVGGKAISRVSGAADSVGKGVRSAGAWAKVGGTIVGDTVIPSRAREKGRLDGLREGREIATAETAVKFQVLQDKMVQASERFQEQHKYNEFTVCLIAVGAAMAAADGYIHEDEESNLREFVLGMSAHAVPPSIQNAIEQLLTQPPTFDGAMLYVEKLDRTVWSVIDSILAIVSEADRIISEGEQVFLEKWQAYKASHAEEK